MRKRRIYLLSPQQLPPETIAVAFAKTSRSPESFDQIAAGLTGEETSQFHEKWVVGYGHASVAEHAVLHIAFENVSRLAIESIESNRLASYTEKSTRYQKWKVDGFHFPDELAGHRLAPEYLDVCRLLFETYLAALKPARRLVLDRAPRPRDETDDVLDRRLRSQYVDACRFLLPASALANVGMTANARVLENAIRKMLSHELAEVRGIGEHVKIVALTEVPTLVKYAKPVPRLSATRRSLKEMSDRGFSKESRFELVPGAVDGTSAWCSLEAYDERGEDRVLAAALYRHSEVRAEQAMRWVEALGPPDREELARKLLGDMAPHDVPTRELEYSNYTFDLVMDQGAYAEFKRHRIMSQTPQRLTTHLGYSIPELLVQAGSRGAFEIAMRRAVDLFDELESFDPYVAQYIVPNAFNRRVLARFNLREAFAFCELRSSPNAHFSIRRIAEQIALELRRVHPLLARYMRLPAETPTEVERANFAATAARI